MMMKTFLLLFLTMFSTIKSDLAGNVGSVTLDFIPVIGNVKAVLEAASGTDIVTGEELTTGERILALAGVLPFGYLIKGGKHMKNGVKFVKASERAAKLGKMKNAVNFMKAGTRAMNKANKIPKMLSNGIKGISALFRVTANKTQE